MMKMHLMKFRSVSSFPINRCMLLLVMLLIIAGCTSATGDEQAAAREPTKAVAAEAEDETLETPAEGDEAPAPVVAEMPSDGTSMDIWKLISVDEVSELLGEPMNAGEFSDNPAVGQKILFFSAQAESLPLRFFQISLSDNQAMPYNGMKVADIFEQTRELVVEDAQDVPGYGDAAYWGMPGLHILKGDYYLVLSVGNTDNPDNLELAKKFADIILPRLP